MTEAITQRRAWMAVLARADAASIRALLGADAVLPAHARLRGPEVGMVMLRGRIGGDGQTFNLGEATVTRCTVRAGDFLGHAIVLGRDLAHAELAARLDAALQDPALGAALRHGVIEQLAAAQAARRDLESRQAAATRVDFATLATMRG